jgi:hypothetical protein
VKLPADDLPGWLSRAWLRRSLRAAARPATPQRAHSKAHRAVPVATGRTPSLDDRRADRGVVAHTAADVTTTW